MGIDGTSKPWHVAGPPSPALKRLAAETPEQQYLRWRERMRRYGLSESQITHQWGENQRKLAEFQGYLATQGIRLITKDGNLTEEGL